MSALPIPLGLLDGVPTYGHTSIRGDKVLRAPCHCIALTSGTDHNHGSISAYHHLTSPHNCPTQVLRLLAEDDTQPSPSTLLLLLVGCLLPYSQGRSLGCIEADRPIFACRTLTGFDANVYPVASTPLPCS